jgi:glycosyltransferase involved in cell wall biosynthesis
MNIQTSVIITTHNRSALLAQAIESVLAQKGWQPGRDGEVIVVDDDSTDDTWQVVARYPSVRYLHTSERNCAGARNAGIAASQGNWVAFLDDDDMWLPTKMEAMHRLIEANPCADVAYCATRICDNDMRGGTDWQGPDAETLRTPNRAFVRTLIQPSCVHIKMEALQRYGVFDPSLKRTEDRELWFRFVRAGARFAETSEVHALYRLAGPMPLHTARTAFRETMLLLRHHWALLGRHKPPYWWRTREVLHLRGWYSLQLLNAAERALKDGQVEVSGNCSREAWLVSPLHVAKHRLFSRRSML